MNYVTRLSVLFGCFLGVIVGADFGRMVSMMIANKLSGGDIFALTMRFSSPSPMRIGQIESGDYVLCDMDGKAWSLVSYGVNEHGFSRMWRGIQDLAIIEAPRLRDGQEHIEVNGVSMPVAYQVEQQKCI